MQKVNKTVNMIDTSENYIMENNIDSMYQAIRIIADKYDVEMTENARKIA